MRQYAPSPPWTLACPWCEWYLVVNGRGARGADQGAGVEAADRMHAHVGANHNRTWDEFLATREHAGAPPLT